MPAEVSARKTRASFTRRHGSARSTLERSRAAFAESAAPRL
jgi:hypothetical protein